MGIEDFYTMLSGETVELNGFLDLSAMAAAAGYKFRARNMTALGVQVLGTVLNKTVSTGDDLWGLPWKDMPPAFKFTELVTSDLDLSVIMCWPVS